MIDCLFPCFTKFHKMNTSMNPNFPTHWDLSETTSLRWMAGGTLRFSRQKFDILGRKKESAYKVYVKPLTYVAILGKKDEVEEKMLELVEGEEGPIDVELHDDAILQLSLVQDSKKEKRAYYGIHRVDCDNQIVPGLGLNLTQLEYLNFIEMLMQWRGGFEKKAPTPTKGKSTKKKRKVTFPDGSAGSVPTQNRPYFPEEGASTSNPQQNKSIKITYFGWEWYPADSQPSRSRSQGHYFVNPKNCLDQAMSKKPEGDYRLETFARKDFVDIDDSMFDSAYGSLLIKNILHCKAEAGYAHPELNVREDFEVYGEQAWKMISISHIYNLVKKAIELHDDFNQSMKVWLMNRLALHTVNEGYVIDYMKEGGYLTTGLCDELFQYIDE